MLAWPFCVSPAAADIRLPKVIGNHMVLQQAREVRIWGFADPGEGVTVEFRTKTAKTSAGADGKWEVRLPGMSAGGPHELTISGRNRIVLSDVLVGEVWVCSGQSNMAWAVGRSANAEAEIARADSPLIRLYKLEGESLVPETPQDDAAGAWEVSSPGAVKDFSAVAYFFARELQASQKVPVGVIQSARGGTPVEAWMSRAAIERVPAFRPVLTNWDRVQSEYPELHRKHEEWRAVAARARAEGKPVPAEPLMGGQPGQKNTPGGLFNSMIAPVTPYTIRGAIWYQGESNVNGVQYEWTTSFHDLYEALFPALIEDWRRVWDIGNFPFLFVQLANFGESKPAGTTSWWAEVREAQLKALSVPRTGMAVAIDIGDPRDIHPKNKQEVSRRLALAARSIAYGERVAHTGPRCRKVKVRGAEVWLDFETAGGLTARGDRPSGFTVAGKDRRFFEADARIEGNRVVVSSPSVAEPVAVRYGWADNPACNLYDGTNLPASPFRTDDWPLD